MKATDLMIGDWVKCGRRYMKVTQLAEDMDCDDIEPIPLTAEILEKNGFVGELCSNGIDYVSEEYKLRIICKTNDVGWTIYANHFGLDKKDVFVHELQHALRLCRIEKEIEL